MKNFLIGILICNFQTAFSFTLTGQNPNFKGWASGEVQFAINSASCPAGINVKTLMEESFAIWNDVPTSRLKLTIVGETTSVTNANPVTVHCVTTFPGGFPAGSTDSIPGYALNVPTGDYATSGYVVLNATSGQANIAGYNRELLKLIIAHEVGHVLGFGHSQDINALMYYNASLKTTLTLGQDDIDAISYLYPRNELSGAKPLGCAMVKNMNDDQTKFLKLMSLVFLLFPIAIALRLRSQKLLSLRNKTFR